MNILKKSLCLALLLSSVAPCVCAETVEPVPTNLVQVQEKEVEQNTLKSQVSAFLLEAYSKHIGKACKACCPGGSCPTAKNAVIVGPEVLEQDIKKAIEFVQKGADVNSKVGYSPSFLCVAALLDDVQLIELLLEKSANPNTDDIISPLLLNTMLGGNKEITKLLIDHGADVNFQIGKEMQTPLMMAISKKDIETARLFIEKGADVNIQGKISMLEMTFNALSLSIAMKDLEMTTLLLENGANPNIICKFKYDKIEELTTLGVAKKEECSQEMIDLLIKYDAK